MIRLDYPFGSTPLDPNEINGLIPQHIQTQAELNEWEQANILEAELWLSHKNFKTEEILNLNFITQLHRKMFNKTWEWSGKFRISFKNIGVDPIMIANNTKQLIDDTLYQLDRHVYSLDEIATRFHHRLVSIHLFSNGNGRHARLMTDLLLISQHQQRFSWGYTYSHNPIELRKKYIAALRAADKHDYTLLLKFVKQ